MKVVILQQALEELNDAVNYYEEKQPALGLKLKEEIETHVNWIIQNPDVPGKRADCYRRVNLKIFPYYIAYTFENKTIWILSISHSYRKPQYWIERSRNIPVEIAFKRFIIYIV